MIAVEGMDMPKSCYECDFNVGEYTRDYWEKRYCVRTGSGMTKTSNKRRNKDCPLIEMAKCRGV